jgi:hypothetical protein
MKGRISGFTHLINWSSFICLEVQMGSRNEYETKNTPDLYVKTSLNAEARGHTSFSTKIYVVGEAEYLVTKKNLASDWLYK